MRESRAAATRAAILDAARELFIERGYHQTSIEDIVATSGVGTRGALYHHFDSKIALFEEVFSEVVAEFMAISDALIDEGVDPLDRLRKGLQSFLAGAADVAAVQRIILIDGPAVLGADRWRALQTRRGVEEIASGLDAAITAGIIAAQPTIALAQLMLAVVDEAAIFVAKSHDRAKAQREVGAALDNLVNGLRIH